ncbi:hypothetical protein RISK_002371 [Rhodopirellula islandica]|uniref:Type II secretion system protein H n=1 Tax=Rhodopirellula islandica TaxID=595434 RepID=A0A0J1EJQ0_RHOIS|nr:hypothetical protein RISK_002371 [Rhodopirellula islandica]
MKCPCKTGFSLLELMIVLTIMVGVGAVAWPSLRRPMADSSVQQAANLLRAEISDCRQTAAIEGEPRLMRFSANQPLVASGHWADLVAEQLIGDRSQSDTATDTERELKTWELPIDIVIDEVQLDQRAYVVADETSMPSDAIDLETSTWYLPFLPSGQTRAAIIVLRDTATHSRVALEIEAVTGMMRTARLSPATPGDASSNAPLPPRDGELSN